MTRQELVLLVYAQPESEIRTEVLARLAKGNEVIYELEHVLYMAEIVKEEMCKKYY